MSIEECEEVSNMDVTSVVAMNIKSIREQKKLTLDAASEITGVSRSMLSQIEKGDVNPTISVLWKIANGYKVSFTSLVERKSDSISILRLTDVIPLKEDDGLYLNYPVFPFDEKTLFETCRIVIEPSGALSAQPHMNGVEEYITVFAGEVEICVSDESYRLSNGDSMRFYANVPHSYRNIGTERVELSMLMYYNK